MNEQWSLVSVLNGAYHREVFKTQAGAIHERERKLQPRRVKDYNSPTEWRTEWPIGWTAIRRSHHGDD